LENKFYFKYPYFNNLNNNRLATNIGIGQINIVSPLKCQMGIIYFFEETLNPSQIKCIYLIGPNYLSYFDQTE
jgi:hypothetical protein